MAEEISSPYQLSMEKDIVITGVATSTLLFGTLFIYKRPSLIPSDLDKYSEQSDIPSYDRRAIYNWSVDDSIKSDIIAIGCVTIPAISIFLNSTFRSDYPVLIAMYMESLLLTTGMYNLTKGIVGRPRPFVYNPDLPPEKKMQQNSPFLSFYSGHTATAFNSAVFLSVVYSDYYPKSKWKYLVWLSALSAATLTGYYRFTAGKHFPSDIATGMVMGCLTGFFIPYIHKKKSKISISGNFSFTESGLSIHISI